MRSAMVFRRAEWDGLRLKKGLVGKEGTNRKKITWNALLLFVVFVGMLGFVPGADAGLNVDQALTGHEGDMYWRWIGVGHGPVGALCHVPLNWEDGWTARPLFDSLLVNRYPQLQRFCVWEYEGSQGLDPGFQSLRCLDEMDGAFEHFSNHSVGCSSSGFTDLEPDILAVTPTDIVKQKSASGDAVTPVDLKLESFLLKQTGQFSLALYSPSPKIRMTLVDTSPTEFGPTISERSPHGISLRKLAQELLCQSPNSAPPAGCIVDIRSRLALAYEESFPALTKEAGRNEENGGFSGLIGELGEVLMDELDAWHASNDDTLVMSLSVAWDRVYGGGTPVSYMPPSAQAVYRALEVVACEGAVVIAAAGNLRDHHPNNPFTQPMLPGAWAERKSSACASRPQLLWATGAFNATRRPVSNALADGVPEFVAYGENAVIVSGVSPTPPLTGSSVSTLVVSAAAAAAAYYDHPNASPSEIMTSVYDGGELIDQEDRAADFCSPVFEDESCPSISYVSVCSAAYEACLSSSCPPALKACPSRPSSRPVFETASFLGFGPPIQGTRFSCILPGCADVCKTDSPLSLSPLTGAEVCPRRQHHSAARRPGTQPQPEVGLCPSCVYDVDDGSFHGEVHLGASEWAENPTLHLTCNGVKSNYLLAQSFSSATGPQTTVKGKWTNLPLNCDSASMSYNFYKGSQRTGSSTVPITVGSIK